MKPEVAVFTRDNPVRKPDLWRCFRRSHNGFATVQVDDAHAIIGKNAPRYMEREGFLVREETSKGDYYVITTKGGEWLIRGIEAYVKNHPSARAEIEFFPGSAPPGRRIRRVR